MCLFDCLIDWVYKNYNARVVEKGEALEEVAAAGEMVPRRKR
jgi:hypothetical protein